ncbi:MAG: hypothetical protein Q7J15_07885 [Candidatus Desulfaltia sp.]|nr:hypothetical protein [Candidatus Desulfaltia sp.]
MEGDQAIQNDGLMIVSEDVADGDPCWRISQDLQGEYCVAKSGCPCLAHSVDYLYIIEID